MNTRTSRTRSVLPVLRDWCDLEAPASLAEAAPPDPEFSFRISLKDGQIVCWPKVAYGQWETLVGGPEDIPGQPPRDLAAEYHVLDVLEDYFPVDEGRLVFDEEDEELLYRLLTDGLAELSALGEVLLSDRLRAINVRPSPSLSVRATVKSNLLDVELGASGLTQRELLDYLAGWKRKQKFVRLSTGDIVRIGENLQFADELADGLGVSVEELVGGDFGLPSSRALLIDALLDRADGIRLNRDSGFRRLVRDFDTYSDADIEVPADLKAELRAYQEDGFRWLGTLERFGFGGILADDMGLGKTLQVIAHILARKEAASAGRASNPPAPRSLSARPPLVYNWMSEIAKFAPSLDAVAVVGTKTARTAVLGGAAGKDVLVTSYDLLRRDVESYAKVRFARVVLDEAQYIKNPKAQVTKCVECLDADVRFALTGTPIENRLAELWSIFDFLMPGYLGSREQFAKRYEGPVEHADHDSSNLLRCAIGPFVLRRLKSEVLADLPEKTESVVYAQMEAKQRKLYLASQDRLALQVQHLGDRQVKQEKLKVLAELTKLRQLCCDPRLYFEAMTVLPPARDLHGTRLAGSGGRAQGAALLAVHEYARADRSAAARRAPDLLPAYGRHEQRGARAARQALPGRGGRRLPHLAQGGRSGAQPHICGRRHPLRPLVEHGGAGPGDRPCPPHRSAQGRQRLQAHLRGDDRGTHPEDAGVQARPRRQRALRRGREVGAPHPRRSSRPPRLCVTRGARCPRVSGFKPFPSAFPAILARDHTDGTFLILAKSSCIGPRVLHNNELP